MIEWSGNGKQLSQSRCSNALPCPFQTWISSSKGKSFSPGRIRCASGQRSVRGAHIMAIPPRSVSWCNALLLHLAAHAVFCCQVSQHVGDQNAWDYANVFWSRGMVVRSDVVFSPAARTHEDYIRLADTCSLFNLRVLQSGVQKWTKYVLEAAEKYKKTDAHAKAHPVCDKMYRAHMHAAREFCCPGSLHESSQPENRYRAFESAIDGRSRASACCRCRASALLPRALARCPQKTATADPRCSTRPYAEHN